VLYFFGVGIWFLFKKENVLIVQSLAALFLSRVLITNAISYFYKKQRPYQKYKFTPVYFSKLFSFKTDMQASFPSGHMAGLAAMSAVLWFYYPCLGLMAAILTILAGIFRTLMGYHYVVDVVAGILIGVASALIVFSL
jgi:undecaprenyl-diphosphatase